VKVLFKFCGDNLEMREINVGIVGCGFIAHGHLKAWKRVPQANIVAVSDLNESLAKYTAKAWNIPHYYGTLSEMLEQDGINVIDVCTPPQVHMSLAVEAMEKGVDVLIEKPMTITVEDAKKIVDCQRKTKVNAGVIHNWLFDAPVLEARSLIKKGFMGEVINVEIEALNTKDDSMTMDKHHWCHKLPGGRFSEMLAHPIYLTRHFLEGEIEVVDVQVSKVGGYPWMKSDELCAIFKVGSKLGRVYATFNSSRDAIYINIYGKEGIIKMDIINSILNFLPRRKTSRFSKGSDSIKQAWQIVKCTAKNMMKVAFKRWTSGHDIYIRLFAESLIHDKEPPVSVRDGLAVVQTLEQMCRKIEEQEKKID